jgi:hypothetical protein
MSHDDLAELRHCHAQLAEYEARCGDLERINIDLESRLEKQAKDRMEVDREIAEGSHRWERRLAEAAAERDEWRARLEAEQRHSEIVREKLRRTEKELHRILQKKYDIVRAAKLEERTAIKEREQISRDLARQAEGHEAAAAAAAAVSSGRSGGGLLGGRGRWGGDDAQRNSMSTSSFSKLTSNPQGAGAVAVREKRVVDSLCDFFGL